MANTYEAAEANGEDGSTRPDQKRETYCIVTDQLPTDSNENTTIAPIVPRVCPGHSLTSIKHYPPDDC